MKNKSNYIFLVCLILISMFGFGHFNKHREAEKQQRSMEEVMEIMEKRFEEKFERDNQRIEDEINRMFWGQIWKY